MTPAQDDQRNLQWVHIDDFTPGVYDNSFISVAEPKLSAPLGSADATATFCCAALKAQDGLGPLPALTETYTYTEPFPGTLTKFFVVGFIINPGLGAVEDEAVIMLEGDDGTDHYVVAYSTIPQTGASNLISGPTITSGTVAGIFGAPYPAFTRLSSAITVASCVTTSGSNVITSSNNFVSAGVTVGATVVGSGISEGTTVLMVASGSITISSPAFLSNTVTLTFSASSPPPPPPKIVFPTAVSTDTRGVDGHLWVYPADPVVTNTYSAEDLITGVAATPPSSVTGQVITYGSRIICLVGVNYTWPVPGGIGTNENINFTDPPQTNSYGNQEDVIAAEQPWGYGAWGTISVGELFLIKKNGGGLVIYGDIDAISSAVPMPGVQSVGDFVGKASAGPMGLVYCSEQRGAWTWNGGNTAQKISQQLRDNFYDATTGSGMQGNNYGFDVYHWQNWILFSNNFMFNMDTGSWWPIYPTTGNGNSHVTGHTMWWWYEGRFGNQMYAAPIDFTTTSLAWYYLFDDEVPAPHWQWQSLPIHVTPNADRVLDVRQVVLRLSDPSASGNATATVTVNGTVLGTVTGIPGTPMAYRFDAGVTGIQDIVIKVTGDNAVSGSSPILHSIDIGWQDRAGVPVSN